MKKLIYTVLSSEDPQDLSLVRLFHQSVRNVYTKTDVEFGVICRSTTWEMLNLSETHISNSYNIDNLDDDHPFNSVLNVRGESDYHANKFLVHEYIDCQQYSQLIYMDYDCIICSDIFKYIQQSEYLHLHGFNNSDSAHPGLFAFHVCEEKLRNMFKLLYKNYLDDTTFNFNSYIQNHVSSVKFSFNPDGVVWSYVPSPGDMERKFINFGRAKMKQLPNLWKFNGKNVSMCNKISAMEKCLELCNNFQYNETTV